MVGKIYISGLIGTYGEEKGVELIDVISQVRKQPDATSYEVYINSEGGVVDTGFDIYNYLISLGLPVTTIAGGVQDENFKGNRIVASIATVPFMAGHKRVILPNTRFMIHAPMGSIELASAEEMQSRAEEIKKVEEKISKFYSEQLNLGKEAIAPLLKKDTWINPEQLDSLGFTTKDNSLQLVARVNVINEPKIKNTMTKKSKFQAILDIIKGKEIVNKTIFSADPQKEIIFPDLADDAPIEVGAKATYDGQPAEGEITGADGMIYVFAAGVLTEIKDPNAEVEDALTDEQMLEALTATLEVAAELQARVESLETETVAVKKERDEFKVKLDSANAIIAKLKGSSKTVEEQPKEKEKQKNGVSDIVAKFKADKFKKN